MGSWLLVMAATFGVGEPACLFFFNPFLFPSLKNLFYFKFAKANIT
jgi:hypothetical protein